mgnify:CR=1 FL=1
MVVDSDVFIDFFRDTQKAREFFLENNQSLIVSRVTILEIILGVKTKRDATKALKQLDSLGVHVVEVNENISKLAGELFLRYWHRYGIGILDCLVAATALTLREALMTRNVRHFRPIESLELQVPY